MTATEWVQLPQWQEQWRANNGYATVTLLPILDAGWLVATIAKMLGLDQARVYRNNAAFAELGLAKSLVHEKPGH